MGAHPRSGLLAGSRLVRSRTRRQERKDFVQECWDRWEELGQEPGTHLWWVPTRAVRRDLWTAEQQRTAFLRYALRTTVSTGERAFTWKRVRRSSRPGIAEIVLRSHREGGIGGFLDASSLNGYAPNPVVNLRKLVDDTGTPILYTSGRNAFHQAGAFITFPNRRWLQFPVRGTQPRNAIMTAVDQAGNKVARYRIIGPGSFGAR